MSEARSVAVVIPSWNSLGLLPRCLDSVRAQGGGLELMVVDNGSEDGTLAYLEEEGVPHLALPRNIGFAPAVNLGVRRTEAEAVLVLNADATLEPGCAERLLGALRSDPGLGGVAPRILQTEARPVAADSARLYSAGQALTVDGRAIEIGAGERQEARYLQRREVFGVCGAACLLRRQMFDDLGGYDESYFAFYEDVDLNVRARVAGWRFLYEPTATAWHLGNTSWLAEAQSPGAWNARLVARNRIATQAKFMSAAALPRIAMVEAGALTRAATQRRFGATARGKLEGLARLSHSLRSRRRLARSGDLALARRWLGA